MLADSQHSNSDHAHSPSSSVILGNSDSADAAPNSTSQEEITGHSENGLDTDDDGRGSSVVGSFGAVALAFCSELYIECSCCCAVLHCCQVVTAIPVA